MHTTRMAPSIRALLTGIAAIALTVALAWSSAGPAQAAPFGPATRSAAAAPTLVVAKSYSKSTVAKHHTATNCWSIVDRKVYNLTKWIAKHPGGRKRIIRMCGKDATTLFHSYHSGGGRAGTALKRYYLGRLK